MNEKLYKVQAPFFVAGLVVDVATQKITKTAPILAWARSKDFHVIEKYCIGKAWLIECIGER